MNHPTLSYKDRVVSVAATRAVRARARGARLRVDRQPRQQRVGARRAARAWSAASSSPTTSRRARCSGSAIFGPTILAIAGNYDDVNRLCTQVADRLGWGFVNINLRSYYAEGAKTMGFEIVEQLGWRYPAAPRVAGRGRDAAAAHRARASRAAAGRARRGRAADAFTRRRRPAARRSSTRSQSGRRASRARCGPNTIAKSIAIGNPADGYQVLQTVRDTGGSGAAVSDAQIVEAIRLLAETEGHLHRAGRRHDARRRHRSRSSAA